MTRFKKTEKYVAEIESYDERGDVDYATDFELDVQEWGAFAGALRAAIECADDSSISMSSVLIVDGREVVVSVDDEYFLDDTMCICVFDGDSMGPLTVSLPLEVARELLDDIAGVVL